MPEMRAGDHISPFRDTISTSVRGTGTCRGAYHSGAKMKGSSFHKTSPFAIFSLATRPFPLIASKYLTSTRLVHLLRSRLLLRREEGWMVLVLALGIPESDWTSPSPCKIFLTRLSLTVHDRLASSKKLWILATPEAGLRAFSSITTFLTSSSVGMTDLDMVVDFRPWVSGLRYGQLYDSATPHKLGLSSMRLASRICKNI
jgi:hypothetical protein